MGGLLAAACGGCPGSRQECAAGKTVVDGACVSPHIAGYIACVRAPGAQLGEARASKLQADAKVAGAGTSVVSDVSDELERKYADSSEANELEIIRACRALNAAGGEELVEMGREPPVCTASPEVEASGNAPSGNGQRVRDDGRLRTCDANDPLACNNLGRAYDAGRGVAADLPRATELFRRACDGGNPHGCANLGWAFATGRGVPADRARRVEFLRTSCRACNTYSCDRLAELGEAP